MLKLFGYIGPRCPSAAREARPQRAQGPLTQMLIYDVNNLDRLTRALAEHRR